MERTSLAAITIAALLAATPAWAQKSADTARIAFADPISTVDGDADPKPETSFTSKAVFDSLIYYSPDDAEFKPLLAESWKRIDQTTVEFKLRRNVKWHDGEPFDADDVVFTINWILDPKTKYRFKGQISFIKGVEKIDPYTVRITADEITAYDLARYALTLRIRPQHAQSKFADWTDFGRKNPIGTSMFRVVSIDTNKGLVLEKYAGFAHGKEAGIAAHVGRIHAVPIPEVQTQVAQLLTGGLDIMSGAPKDQAENLDKDPKFEATATQSLVFFYLALDAAGRSPNKAMTDQRVRKAVMMAIDREALAQNVIAGGSEVRTIDAVCFRVQQGCDYSTKPVGYDPAAAKKLLAEAGYPNGFDLEIGSFSGGEEVAEAVAGQLRAVGIRASNKFMTFGVYRKWQADGQQTALVGRYSSGGLPDASALTSYFFERTPRDYYHDDVLDKLSQQGGAELDVEKRKAIYRQAMDRINEKNYILPIATNPAVFVHTADIKIKKGSLNNFAIEASDISWK